MVLVCVENFEWKYTLRWLGFDKSGLVNTRYVYCISIYQLLDDTCVGIFWECIYGQNLVKTFLL